MAHSTRPSYRSISDRPSSMSRHPEPAHGLNEPFGQNANQITNAFSAPYNNALPHAFWTQIQNGTSSTDTAAMLPPPISRNGVPIPPPSFTPPVGPSYSTSTHSTTRDGMSVISPRQRRAAADSVPRLSRQNSGRNGAEREEGELSDADLPFKGSIRATHGRTSPRGGGESYRANGELPNGRAGRQSDNSFAKGHNFQKGLRGTKAPPKQPRNFNRSRPVSPQGAQQPGAYENYRPAPEPVSPQIDGPDVKSAKPKPSSAAFTERSTASPMAAMPLAKQEIAQSLHEQRKQAKHFIQLMHQNNFTFDQLKQEGLDYGRLRRLYEEAGLPVPSGRSMSPNGNTPSVAAPSSAQTKVSIVPQPKINATLPHGKKAEALDRKDYIARLMAAKTSKPVISALSSKTPSATPIVAKPPHQASSPPNRKTNISGESTSQIKMARLPEKSEQQGQTTTTPTHDTQSLVSAAKKRAQTELARQRMEALNAARVATTVKGKGQQLVSGDEPEDGTAQVSRTVNSGTTATEKKVPSAPADAPEQSPPPRSPATENVSMPADPIKTADVKETLFQDVALAARLPSVPAQPALAGLGQFNNVIPGLFMTASTLQQPSSLNLNTSGPPMTQQTTAPAETELSEMENKQVAINPRKRPVASDFQDDYSPRALSAFKRPFGQARYEALPEKIVINTSDDEDPSSDEDESMNLSNVQSAFGSVTARARQPAVRDLPPLTNFPPQAMPKAKTGSLSNSLLNTPGAVTPGLARDLKQVKRKEEEISLMKRKIAELEQRQKVRVGSSGPHTPAATQTTDSAASNGFVSVTNPNSAASGAGESSKVAEIPVNETVSPAVNETMEVSNAAAAINNTDVDPAEVETTIRKKKRRAEIQSNLPALEASMASSQAKLVQLKREMAMLEAAMQKGMEDKEALIQEMGSLGIDTEGMHHSDLKATKEEMIRERDINAGAVSGVSAYMATTGLADQEANAKATSITELPKTPAHAAINSIPTDSAPTLTKDESAEPQTHTTTHGARLFNQLRPVHENSHEDAMDISDDSSADSGEVANGPHSISSKTSADYNVLDNPVRLSTASMEPREGNAQDSLNDTDMEDDYTTDLAQLGPAQMSMSEPRRPRPDEISSAEASVQQEVARNAMRSSTVTSSAEDGRSEASGLPSSQSPALTDDEIQQDRDSAPLRHARTNAPDDNPVTDQTPLHIETRQTSTLTGFTADSRADILGRDVRLSKALSQDTLRKLNIGTTSTSLTKDYPGTSITRQHYFTPYISPLKIFKGYRYHPDYSKDVPGGFRSMTYSHDIDPNIPICMFEAAGGTCNDVQCSSQHFRKMSLSDDMVLVQLGTANPGRTEEERVQWTKGLRAVLNDLRSRKIKDPEVVAAQITDYRREFLNDPSKILNL